MTSTGLHTFDFNSFLHLVSPILLWPVYQGIVVMRAVKSVEIQIRWASRRYFGICDNFWCVKCKVLQWFVKKT